MKLEKGEVKCDRCKGRGTIPSKDHPKMYIYTERARGYCPKCLGNGKLDWVENIIEKKADENISGKPRFILP